MKIKVTIWCEDPESTDIIERDRKFLREAFKTAIEDELGLVVKQIEIEESDFED